MKRQIVIALFPVSALAANPCDYQHQVTGRYTKEITRVENIDREVFVEFGNIRKCVVELDAWVDGAKHRTEGSFSFGPDMAETAACAQAEQRAKESLIRKTSPEILTADTRMVCNNRDQTPAPTQAQPAPQVNQLPPVVHQMPPVQRVYGVIPGRPVYTIHSNRVYFEPNPNLAPPTSYQSPRPTIQPYPGR